MARALAVAGIHEIEELVADEIPVLPGDPVPNGHGSRPAGALVRSVTSGGNGAAVANGHGAAKPPAAPGDVRPLLLVFKVRTAGLLFQAFWLDANGRSRQPALGTAAHANGHAPVSSSERAKLINLAAYARRAHFHYHQENGQYLMESLVEIPNFLKTVLPAWRRHFVIELDDRAALLQKGTRTIEIEAVAERAGAGAPGSLGASGAADDGLNLRWIFRAGERMLTAAGHKCVYLPHCVDTRVFRPLDDRAQARAGLGTADVFTLLTVASVAPASTASFTLPCATCPFTFSPLVMPFRRTFGAIFPTTLLPVPSEILKFASTTGKNSENCPTVVSGTRNATPFWSAALLGAPTTTRSFPFSTTRESTRKSAACVPGKAAVEEYARGS
jgi:hypothetical protein